jgi:hypothetical protein
MAGRPCPPFVKGGNLVKSHKNLPPFVKGDRGGFRRGPVTIRLGSSQAVPAKKRRYSGERFQGECGDPPYGLNESGEAG